MSATEETIAKAAFDYSEGVGVDFAAIAAEVRGQLAELDALQADAARFLEFANCERVCATNKWLVQVTDKSGRYHTAYFGIPSSGKVPGSLYATRVDALRSAIDAAIKEAKP